MIPFSSPLLAWFASRRTANAARRWPSSRPPWQGEQCSSDGVAITRAKPLRGKWSRQRNRTPARREQGFSLIEQIVSIGLVAVIVPSLALLLSGLVRQASSSDAQVNMIILARSQLESVKQQPYQSTPAQYETIGPVPSGFSIITTTDLVRTYRYPAPLSSQLPDEIQLITVEVTCLECVPLVAPLILQDYKVRR